MTTTNEAVLTAVAGVSEPANPNPEMQIVVAPSKRVLANRCNAQKSTGPKTPRGKARSSGNSRKLGLLAKEIIGANEDSPKVRAEYNGLLTAVQGDLSPVGALEDMQVDIIAACYWRLARVMRFELRQANRAITVEGECLPYRGDDDMAGEDILKQIRLDPEGIAQKLDRSVEIIKESIEIIRSNGYLEPEEVERLRIVPGDLWQRCAALQPDEGVHVLVDV